MPRSVIYIVAGALFLGIMPLPYDYYTLLRIIACVFFIWAAFIAFEQKRTTLPWVFCILSILFNPLIKIHLSKPIWMIVDASAAIFILMIQSKLNKQNENKL